MKVEVKIAPNVEEAYAVIYTPEINSQVQEAVASLNRGWGEKVVMAINGERTIILNPTDIYMIRVESGKTIIYGKDNQYQSKKRLYELLEQVGSAFIQISKSAVVNFKYLDSVEPYLNGMMNIKLKNNMTEYISRKYLAGFKRYLGI
ncbi:MAG: LytTR family transcriptional regulator [Clostridiales bacterium]|nr:LytTR family transcriptional regulator [Clostridiales bacterium]